MQDATTMQDATGTSRRDMSFGLLGRKLGHSWSARIHAHFSEVPYLIHELEPDELAAFIRENDSWTGLNVTIPYKVDVIPLADVCSCAVRRLGAANTLLKRADGSIVADNTDLAGFTYLLDRFCLRELGGHAPDVLRNKDCVVLGSGGASRAVVGALEDVSAIPHVISRRGFDTYETLMERHAHAFLVVNATPVGMYPDSPASLLSEHDLRHFSHLAGVLDLIYNPLRSGICLAAEKLGIPSEGGLGMLCAQAFRSSELWQGKTLDPVLIEEVERELVCSMLNICLIGMPGAGKTSAGRALARMLGRPFVDMDNAFTINVGKTPADVIREEGEEHFRELETQQLEIYGKESGLVIACGGGVVTRERNYELMHQNGVIVMLDRALGELSSEDRPLSQRKGVNRLAEERMPRYRGWADHVMHCQGSARADAAYICRLLGFTNMK